VPRISCSHIVKLIALLFSAKSLFGKITLVIRTYLVVVLLEDLFQFDPLSHNRFG
jgi:hypothetical protein